MIFSQKTCPTHRGLRLNVGSESIKLFRRKTYPTNRGLRPKKFLHHSLLSKSEDLPHASGVSIFSDDLKSGSSENVGRILESDKYSDVST